MDGGLYQHMVILVVTFASSIDGLFHNIIVGRGLMKM